MSPKNLTSRPSSWGRRTDASCFDKIQTANRGNTNIPEEETGIAGSTYVITKKHHYESKEEVHMIS